MTGSRPVRFRACFLCRFAVGTWGGDGDGSDATFSQPPYGQRLRKSYLPVACPLPESLREELYEMGVSKGLGRRAAGADTPTVNSGRADNFLSDLEPAGRRSVKKLHLPGRFTR